MKNSVKAPTLAAALATLSLLSAVGTAQATLFEIDFTKAGAFSGTAPSSPTSSNTIFATAIFDDHNSTGTVTLTMTVLNNLSSGAYVNDWYFNSSTAAVGFNFVSGTEAASVGSYTNAFKAGGTGGEFDLIFDFFTKNSGVLAQGHTSVYTLTDAGLTASSFNSVSVPAPNGGGYVGAIHLQGYGNSVWVAGSELIQLPENPVPEPATLNPVPEPATLALLGLGLFALGITRKRKQ